MKRRPRMVRRVAAGETQSEPLPPLLTVRQVADAYNAAHEDEPLSIDRAAAILARAELKVNAAMLNAFGLASVHRGQMRRRRRSA